MLKFNKSSMEGTGEYMIILYDNGEAMGAMSEEERGVHMQKWYDWTNEMIKKGYYKSGHPYSMEVRTISGKDTTVTKEFFAKGTNFVLGGYYIFKGLGSMDDVVDVTKGCPIFEVGGTIEVRELMNMPEEVR